MSIRFRKGKKHGEADLARLVAQESLILETTEEICRVLETKSISRSELARRLGKSKSFVTQVLSGERNMTLNTASDFAFALGHRLHVRALPAGGRTRGAHPPFYLPVSVSSVAPDIGQIHRSAALAGATNLTRMWAQTQSKRTDAVNPERWSPATQSVECDEAQEGFKPDHEFALTA